MFTGIVSDIGRVVRLDEGPSSRRLRIEMSRDDGRIDLGASIACAGVCLTVVETGVADARTWFDVEAGFETLRATTLGTWEPGTRVNLERALRAGDELGGHLVQGHVDGVARVEAIEPEGDAVRYRFAVPDDLAGLLAPKGSVTLDGTSLTVNGVADATFWVMMIPHTLSVTTWGARSVGDAVNIEVDAMARQVVAYIEHYMRRRPGAEGEAPCG